jgi:predicted porin
MKKSLLALAVLGAFAGAASAQSSVTLFGIVDTSAANISNKTSAGVKTTTQQLRTDGINSSRLGFRGVEDLGGGLKAGFWLEAGVNPDVGTTNSKFFNRRSTVSLMGGFGEIRLGRDYTPSFWNLTVFDPFGTNGVGSLTNLLTQPSATTALNGTPLTSGATTLVRADNTIGYFLPSGIGGVYGQAQVAAGEGADTNKYVGGRLGYAAGPVDVAVGYGQTGKTNKFKLLDVGGAFTLGPAKLTGQYVQEKQASVKNTVYQLGTVVTMGQGELHAAYTHANMEGGAAGTVLASNSDANQIAVGYVYNLSKRTALYGTGSRIKNKGAANYTVGGPGSAAGGTSTGVEAGLRHSF